MLKVTTTALAGVLVFAQSAEASEKLSYRRVSCAVIRFYVAKYSEAVAEAWARDHGATDEEVEAARRCLSGATVQTAATRTK